MGKRGLVTIDAAKLAELRKAQGLTQVELGIKSGCSLALIGMIEAEQRQPSLDTAKRIAGALQVDLTAIATIAEAVA